MRIAMGRHRRWNHSVCFAVDKQSLTFLIKLYTTKYPPSQVIDRQIL